MHNNYYLIRQIVSSLETKLTSTTLTDCFSQNKDELILQFEPDSANGFNIIAHLDPQFTCLSFPEQYHKAKRNTAEIFRTIIGEKVKNVEGFTNERAFIIHFTNHYSLLFKLFGHQSNILLLKDQKVIDIFRNNLKSDFNLNLESLNRSIDQSKEVVIDNILNIQNVYPTLDKRTRVFIENELKYLPVEQAYNKLSSFINQLENPAGYYIIEDENNLRLSLLPQSDIIHEFDSPLAALNSFFKLHIKKYKHQARQQQILKELQQKIKKTESYIRKTQDKKEKLEKNTSYKEIADIIMANLSQIEEYSSSVVLDNFYSNEPVKIKLNPKLSAQKNAEKYYNKAKNLGLEMANLTEVIKAKEHQVAKLKRDLEQVKSSSSIRDLQTVIKVEKGKSGTEESIFKQFTIDGFTVFVGKNAKNNDLLTLKHAKKNDVFFHAKDVSGSHVILKAISGRDIPAAVLEKTAALAAYYSKRKTDSLCPVGYTPKKYVRKPKRSAPGLVFVEREKVLLVKPALP